MQASAHGHEAVARLLIERGADVNAMRSDGATALMLAAKSGDVITGLLLDRGARVNEVGTFDCGTALIQASMEGCETVARLLIERGADVDLVSDTGFTPLMGAIQNGHEQVARLLLDCGALLEKVRAGDGFTALAIAAVAGRPGLIKLLLERGADPSPVSIDELEPLAYAALKGHDDVVKILLDGGASAASSGGSSGMGLAAQGGHEAVVKLLLEHGADCDGGPPDGRTVLMLAALGGRG
jgi:ankyrin repeat protein